jgi:predicted O-linked N-acetylglucosamine transferase (SPINDLY family)
MQRAQRVEVAGEDVAAPSPPQDDTAKALAQLFGSAEAAEARGDLADAIMLYRAWIARNPSAPLLHAAYFNYGVCLSKSGDRYGAMNALRAALGLKADFLPAHINLGRLLEDDAQAGAAVTQWLTLVAQTGMIEGNSVKHKLVALQQIGRVLEQFQQDEPAEDALRQSLAIDKAQPEVVQHWIALRQRQCKWPAIEASEHVDLKTLYSSISPLSLACLSDDPMFQLARAWKYSRELTGVPKVPMCSAAVARERGGARRRLRIGYVSSDLREHAVGFGMTDVLECHDREAFEIFAYYCGINRTDATQERAQKAVDHWLDISGTPDELVARRIHEDGIDILVDLNGYTKDARSRIFSYRPAPVVVNWFGFPGSMGSTHHNYIIADDAIIPEGDEIFYSEAVRRLPCYQPNDRKRVVAEEVPSRAAMGLPQDAFVYCCLNGCQKLTPETLDSWIEILRQVPDGALWLLSGGAATDERIRRIVALGGIDPGRVIFAEKLPNPQHLARYRLADLFLDNFPYGAHTTASDAMWMGVPVLTYPGKTFASRVCSSLVKAAGLGDIVCDGREGYVARAISLGLDRSRVAALKERLLAARATSVLFDTPLLVRSLEGLYRDMWAEAEAERVPKPDLQSLGSYFDIGLDLHVTGNIPVSRDELCQRYVARFEEWSASTRMAADGRLWQGEG